MLRLLLSLFALVACSQAEEAAPAPEETVAAAEPAAMMLADGMPLAGTFDITRPDGTVHSQVINADGTYTFTDADGTVSTGTVVLKEPNLFCETEGTEGEEVCYAEEVDAAGVWNSVNVNNPEDSSVITRKS